jgi:FkbM family methyltransferase
LKSSPLGQHYGFEPIPFLYENLINKYKKKATIFSYALSAENGKSTFNLVTTNPAYSGLIKRQYDKVESDQSIEVELKKLDDIIPENIKIDFIKIDTEGAEYLVLQGGKATIEKDRPYVLFEFGVGASDVYGTSPIDIFNFFDELNYSLSALENYFQGKFFTSQELETYYHDKIGYSFIACPRT